MPATTKAACDNTCTRLVSFYRGPTICANYILFPLDATEQIVVDTIEGQALHPEIICGALQLIAMRRSVKACACCAH